LKEHGISKSKAIIPDMAAWPRQAHAGGEICGRGGMRLPEAIFLQTVTGDYPKIRAQ